MKTDWKEYHKEVEDREYRTVESVKDDPQNLNYIGVWEDEGYTDDQGQLWDHGQLWKFVGSYKYMCELANLVDENGRCLVGRGVVKLLRCLELGCDWGHSFPVFESCFEEVYGIEVCKRSVEIGQGYGRNIVHGVMECTPWEDNFFDVILSRHVLEHGKSPYAVLKEIWRLTRSGGYSLHTLPCRQDKLINAPSEIHSADLNYKQWTDQFLWFGFDIQYSYFSWNQNQEEYNIIARKPKEDD